MISVHGIVHKVKRFTGIALRYQMCISGKIVS